ncbi:MAG: SLC13 family permease [Flavobacteriales bacterium]|nr:SLC13 family permease [Flavobacteriales bacterium]MCB9198335.1 SLC13 family permease [Flavobacteriales bacterium]
MGSAMIITLLVILGALILFITGWLTVDIVGLLMILALVLSGVITPEEGVSGFSNNATLTVAFMFVISAAVLKTGALQHFAIRLSKIFQKNFNLGMVLMMLLVAIISAFVNNTPVVAVFIPVIIQIANHSGKSPAKMLIPLSFASIFGGMCTLIGTSTNILVDGILRKEGYEGFDMFTFSHLGLIFMIIGLIYMLVLGIRLLPKNRKDGGLDEKFQMKDYVSEIKLQSGHPSIGRRIMDSEWVRDLEMDIIEVRRDGDTYALPAGDFMLQEKDVLKVRCSISKLKNLKELQKASSDATVEISRDSLKGQWTTLVEMVVTANSSFHGKTLKDLDFRRAYRAVPLALKHREEIVHQKLYDTPLKSGDIILAEVKNHYIAELRKIERQQGAPFVMLSEDAYLDFSPRKFGVVAFILAAIIGVAATGVISIMIAAMTGVVAFVLLGVIDMKEVYKAINWQIVFLLAGALSLGTAMQNSGLDVFFAEGIVSKLEGWGAVAVLSGIYLMTSVLTELMSNNATAALMTPIALGVASSLGLNYMPFVIAVMIASSASFMTPIGYQTNAMVFSAGQYKFTDFLRTGTFLNILFWLVATFLIPVFFPF